ncbi:MAG: bifunctional UDP-N-acetylmuramoyl-tripeptide:D-alanyl-D-alanine ligase/alanine racemase [Bacteroidales bacterium]|nr:bifunctional UDP-N-acetylmuramoyl-tripeptide:D-alanyl-D-alanine ligase/alanine racemase [Bacteroidales bacterium]
MIEITLAHEDIVNILKPISYRILHDCSVRYLAWDTRSLPEKSTHVLFVALRGPHHDGHNFIDEAYRKGVRTFLVEKEIPSSSFEDINFFVVSDTIEALQELAIYFRSRFDFPIVAITGSNGKTVVKEWLFQILGSITKKHIFRSPASYNSQIGVPLSVLMAHGKNYTYGIFEAGISQPGEMQKLQKILEPQIGIFTNIGTAHQANFTSLEEKAREKAFLFKDAHLIVYRSSYKEIENALDWLGIENDRRVSWGHKESDICEILSISTEAFRCKVLFRFENNVHTLSIPFSDQGSFENIFHVYVLLRKLGFSHEQLQEEIFKLEPVEMRLEVKEGRNNCIIINDTYNADLNSMTIAFDVLSRFENRKKTVIISDIFQTGIEIKEFHEFLQRHLQKAGVHRLIAIGEQLQQFKPIHDCFFEHYGRTEDFLKTICRDSFHDEVILLKAARSFGFERISALLEEKLLKTRLEIHLQAIAHNLEIIRKKLPAGVRIMAMMKAFGYGGGSIEIARFLSKRNVHYIAVAYTDEGIELRRAGIKLPIMIMEPAENDFFDILQHDLEVEIYDFHILHALINFTRNQMIELDKSISIHLKFDTGMHRLGFTQDQLSELLKLLVSNPQLKVASVFSHFSAADDPQHDDFTRQQYGVFQNIVERLEKTLGYPFLKHICNSAASIRFPEMSMDMVRLGISLLGVTLVKDVYNDLQPVLVLKAPIVQIKNIPPGESIGYNRRAISNKLRKIAILSIGYADGLNRKLGNEQWKVYIHGKEAPIIGDICMDTTFIDVTHLPHVAPGDEAEIFGTHRSVIELSQILGTIPYEIFTTISRRVKRVYIE